MLKHGIPAWKDRRNGKKKFSSILVVVSTPGTRTVNPLNKPETNYRSQRHRERERERVRERMRLGSFSLPLVFIQFPQNTIIPTFQTNKGS
jgi:hypothetical protein